MLICFGYVTPFEYHRVRLLVDVGLFRTRPAKATVDALLKARTATTAKVSVARDSVVYVQGSTAGRSHLNHCCLVLHTVHSGRRSVTA